MRTWWAAPPRATSGERSRLQALPPYSGGGTPYPRRQAVAGPRRREYVRSTRAVPGPEQPSAQPREHRMYASIRRYQLTDGSMDDLLHLVDTDFAESISNAEGFVGYEVLDCDDGRICTISIFRDRESALASDALAMEWVRSTLSPQFAL